MTARQRIEKLFRGEAAKENVVCLHTWGRFIFDYLNRGHLWDKGEGGRPLAQAYLDFMREFPVDLFHVVEARGGKCHRNTDGWPVASHQFHKAEALPDLRGTVNQSDVNSHYDAIESQPWLDDGIYDHVRVLAEECGRETMIFPNIGGPNGELASDFEEAMLQIVDDPERIRRNLFSTCRGPAFARVKAAHQSGADGFIFSLGYGGAMDLISPALTRHVCLDAWAEFFEQIRRLGMFPVGYFLGNICHYMDVIIATRPAAVMIEESKKGFKLDPVKVRQQIPSDIVLFGNVDSLLLLYGTPREIAAEVRRQAVARDYGPFIFDNGSPICPGTPSDNLRAYLDAARDA